MDKIHIGTKVHGRITASRNLPVPGHSRFDSVSLMLPGLVSGDYERKLRAGANKAHVAVRDVPELRQFIETPFTEKSAHRCMARVVFRLVCQPSIHVCEWCAGSAMVGLHGPKLEHVELPIEQADPPLSENDTAAERQPHRNATGQ